jgi:hypothetical protein
MLADAAAGLTAGIRRLLPAMCAKRPGRRGFSWNEANQKQAEDVAIKNCNTTGCKVVFRVAPKQCGAIALTDDGKIWGGSTRPTKAAAELAAIEGCQKRTKVQCAVKGSECNK